MKLLLCLLFVLSGCANPGNPNRHSAKNANGFNWDSKFISVMQGPATATSTVVNFIIPKGYEFDLVISEKVSGNIIQQAVKNTKTTSRDFSPWVIVEAELHQLKADIAYNLDIEVIRGKKSWKERREFSTLNTSKNDYKFLLASCMSDTFAYIGDRAWPSVLKHNPDFYFLIGDQVYADVYNDRYLNIPADARRVWERFVDSRMRLALYRQIRLRPIYAVWDDHDFGDNNGDKTYPYKDETKKIFKTFFPLLDSTNIEVGPGVSYRLKLGQHMFHFLDDRTFRDNNDNSEGHHFGPRQTTWLMQGLAASKEVGGHWIISGDQFFGGYHPYESFEGNHPVQFKEFMNLIKNSGKKVIFVSGDRHLAEIMQVEKELLGYTTYEVTSSGIHSMVFPGSLAKAPNKRRIGGVDGRYNFAIVSTQLNQNVLSLQFTSFDQDNRQLLQKKLIVK
jgi:alkaline phosphatase D